MAKTDAPPKSPGRTPAWKRYLLIGVPLVVVAGVLLVIFLPEIQVRGWINRLGSSDPRVRREQMEALTGHEDHELVNRLLLQAVEEDDRAFDVRLVCANLLIERQRLSQLERRLRSGSLLTRGVVLKALSRKKFFKSTYVDDPTYRAQETVRAWLARDGDLTRSHAIQLAIEMGLADVMPLIRPLVKAPAASNIHPSAQRELAIAAASAVERFADCESVPLVADRAEQDPDPLVRLRCMQILDRAAFRETPPAVCPGAVADERMKAIVLGALDDADHAVRMGAMLILGRKPDWTAEVADRLQAILDGQATAPERRQALETLARVASPEFVERFPRYFHDASAEVRSSAMRVAGVLADVPMTECLIGLLEEETESDLIFQQVAAALREKAGTWVLLSDALRLKAARDRTGFRQDLNTWFQRGELEGVSRTDWAEAWFRWWCAEELKLTPDQTETALRARRAFWKAKAARDVTAARAALDELGFNVPGLFPYERGWLQVHEGM